MRELELDTSGPRIVGEELDDDGVGAGPHIKAVAKAQRDVERAEFNLFRSERQHKVNVEYWVSRLSALHRSGVSANDEDVLFCAKRLAEDVRDGEAGIHSAQTSLERRNERLNNAMAAWAAETRQ